LAKDVDYQLSLGSVVAAVADQVSCDLDGEAVLLSLRTGVYYGLDQVGARIWSLVQGPTTVQIVRDTLLAEYDVEASRCERDLLALLRAMAAEGLVEVRGG
jgi:hypothetical protein